MTKKQMLKALVKDERIITLQGMSNHGNELESGEGDILLELNDGLIIEGKVEDLYKAMNKLNIYVLDNKTYEIRGY